MTYFHRVASPLPFPLPTPHQPLRIEGQSEQVTFDGTWITIQRRGEPVRPSDRRAHVQDVTAIEVKPSRLTSGQFRIEITSSDGRRQRAELAVAFRSGRQDDFVRLGATLEAVRAGTLAPSPPPPPPSVPSAPDPGDELRRLWQLVQVGQLSKEEFEEAKRRLFA